MSVDPDILIIDDSNWQEHADAADADSSLGRGRIPRNYSKCPFGSMEVAPAFPQELIIPRSEWSERIKEKEATKTRNSDLWDFFGIEPLNQGQTNYCWTNGVVTGILIIRALMNEPYIKLSPASVAAIIKNYRNEGGWGGEALEYIRDHGVCTVEDWPANAIDPRYDNATSRANRIKNKIVEYFDLTPRSFDEKASCMLLNMPVPSGYNWWSHETCGADLVEIEPGHYGSLEINSWGPSYGKLGKFVLAESKARGDDQLAVRATSPFRKAS